jgi:hypothetical protein
MPSHPMINCEFCHNEMRRDAYMIHIQSKHIVNLGKMLLRDWASSNITPINQYAQSKSGKIMVVHSLMYEDHEYWFGMRPMFWKNGAKGYSEYIKIEEHINQHHLFIEQILKEISLYDWISIKKDVMIKHPDTETMRRELTDLKKTSALHIEQLQLKLDSTETKLQELEITVDLPYGTKTEMEGKMQWMTCRLEKLQLDAVRAKKEIETLKKYNHEDEEKKNKDRVDEVRYWQDKFERIECAYNKLMDEVSEQKEAIQTRVAKHLEKEEAKKQKELERERTREEEEFKKTEKRFNALKKKLLKKGSDSDSE